MPSPWLRVPFPGKRRRVGAGVAVGRSPERLWAGGTGVAAGRSPERLVGPRRKTISAAAHLACC